MRYSFVVISKFNKGLFKSMFSTYSFGKLFFVFDFDVIFIDVIAFV